MMICSDIFQNSPPTICLKTTHVVAEQCSTDGTANSQPRYNLSRSTNPLLRKLGGFHPRNPLTARICVPFDTAKSRVDSLKNSGFLQDFAPMFCSVTLKCFFFKFSPPARVSKMSFDWNVLLFFFYLYTNRSSFTVFLLEMHGKK